MLDCDDDDILTRLEGIVGGFLCEVELPPSWAESIMGRPQYSAVPNERRTHARRRQLDVAALEYRQTAPALPRPRAWHKVYTTDISLGGIAFLHSEQVFPHERMRIILPGRRLPSCFAGRHEFLLEVARCRRIKVRCYEVGGFFVDVTPAARPGSVTP